jgi:CDP-diglyceride synthetase
MKVWRKIDPRIVGAFFGILFLFLSVLLDNPLVFPTFLIVLSSILFVRNLMTTKESWIPRLLIGAVVISLLIMWFLSRMDILERSLGWYCIVLAFTTLFISETIYRKLRKKKLLIYEMKEG